MFLAALAGLVLSAPANAGAEVWRNYDEVFDLAPYRGTLIAATNGGLLEEQGDQWAPVESPVGLREIVSLDPLALRLEDSRVVRLDGSILGPSPEPRPRSEATGVIIEDFSGPTVFTYCTMGKPGHRLQGDFGGLAQEHDPSEPGAGDDGWKRIPLPTLCPDPRPSGYADICGISVVGGMRGLSVGHPGKWRPISSESVRQVLADRDAVWVVFGSGAVDKVEPETDQLCPDALYGAIRRPWSSCVAMIDGHPVFGGQGGWAEKDRNLIERYPDELKDDVVMAIAGKGPVRWVGTQRSGLFEFNGDRVRFWTPGNGLVDTWVTSLCLTDFGLIVGTASKGLFRLHNHEMKPLDSPTQRVTQLSEWEGRIVVGGMDGAWIRSDGSWQELPTGGEETTALSTSRGRLVVVTAYGVHFIPL